MGAFTRELRRRASDPSRRRWIYAPYDQLTDAVGPLAALDPREAGLVLIEAPAKAARRAYHKQKLALILANQRQFALEQAARGVAVRYVIARGGYRDALEELHRELGAITMMEAAERELRHELAPLSGAGLTVVPHAGWLTTREDFVAGAGSAPPWRLDAFYRRARERTGLLMERGKPEGGRFSFDAENRKPWKGAPPAPTPPRFALDAITREVGELVQARFGEHPGTLDLEALPATQADAEASWAWALAHCLPQFGPFEDAMSTRSSGLFHTRVAPLINLHRLLPARVVGDVATRPSLPLASREGFVRQILGWREFVRHVHVATDGFRSLDVPVRATGAAPSELGAHEPLPAAFWPGAPSGLGCLDRVIEDVWREGWSHHITRLMVLSNFATLFGAEPRALCDWFWEAYIDAFDWVVEPNVLAMGTYGTSVMTTKPYVSGAAYIARMSDYCDGCAFDPKRDCPITRLYWAFLARHAARFGKNPRTAGPVATAMKRPESERALDEHVLAEVRRALHAGERLTPASLLRR